MEYCELGDLNSYLLNHKKDQKYLKAERTAKFVLDLGNGLKFLHENGVIHRDLKPENILVQAQNTVATFSGTKTRSESRVSKFSSAPHNFHPNLKIADFGLSKVCAFKTAGSSDQSKKRKNNKPITFENTIFESACGSDYFMSHEVYSGAYTSKADIFSLGCMLYSLITNLTFVEDGKELFGISIDRKDINEKISAVEAKRKRKLKLLENGDQGQNGKARLPGKIRSSPNRVTTRLINQKMTTKDENQPETTSLPDNENNEKVQEKISLGEAQLIDPGFSLGKLPRGYPVVRANWSKLKAYLLTLLSRNPKERPNIDEATRMLETLVDIRIVEAKYKTPYPKP